MQTNFLHDNRRIESRETYDKAKSSISPRSSPRSVLDVDDIHGDGDGDGDGGETFFVGPGPPKWGIVGDSHYQQPNSIDANCGCFQFMDFFCQRGQNKQDTFVSIPIQDIRLVDEEQISRDDLEKTKNKRYIGNTSFSGQRDEEGESRAEEEEERMDCPSCHHVPSMDEIFSKPLIDFDDDDDDDGDQIYEGQYNRSFSSSSFSEGDGNDGEHGSDDKSEESSIVSFDPKEFEEQEFEADFGLPETKSSLLLHESNRSLHLPTIQEHDEEETSLSCDIDVWEQITKVF